MPQLHSVIGAILRDIAQARVTSDIYSREVSQYYEKDSLLRLFPVPRSEIREVEFELRFAISGVDVDPGRQGEREAKISGIYEHVSEAISEDVFENLRGSETIQKIEEWVNFVATLEKTGLRLEIRDTILEFFNARSHIFLKVDKTDDKIDFDLDTNYLRQGIVEILEKNIYQRADVVEVSDKYKRNRLLSSVKKSVVSGFQDQLNAMSSAIEFMEASQEFKVEVDVTEEKLQQLPLTAISTIKIVTDIRNYTWSQVEERENKIIRRLVPE